MYNQINKNKNEKQPGKVHIQQFTPGGFMQPPRRPDREDQRRPDREEQRRPDREEQRRPDREEQRRPNREEPPFMGPPDMPPGMGMENAPRTAPPNFTPEAPQMERRPMAGPGPSGFGAQFGEDWFVRPREIRRCLNRFTFIWLLNGNSFWFYPTYVGRQFVQGFRWRRNRWEFERINIRRILFFRCF